jgi:YfiH family protein
VSAFELPGGGRALFTAHAEGNLSSEDGAANRERLRSQLGLTALARGYQEHGTTVLQVTAPPNVEDQPRADGQATRLHHVGAIVLAADCVPVALGSPGAVAMLHAGWRGLAAGIVEQGVLTLKELAGTAGPIVAVVGPCAGACCYEVGPEVHEALATGLSGHARIDLRAIARARLRAAGVTEVLDEPACTICDERFFSYRREGAAAGRQAGVAWLS